jgi:hypothetical protein
MKPNNEKQQISKAQLKFDDIKKPPKRLGFSRNIKTLSHNSQS